MLVVVTLTSLEERLKCVWFSMRTTGHEVYECCSVKTSLGIHEDRLGLLSLSSGLLKLGDELVDLL